MARNQFEFLKDLETKKGVKVKTVALLYENTEFGSNVAKMQRIYAKEFGYDVVADIAYPANSSDVTSEVGKIISAKPDVVMHASYITDAILFTSTFKEMNLVPQGFLNMAGYIEAKSGRRLSYALFVNNAGPVTALTDTLDVFDDEAEILGIVYSKY